MRLEELVRGMQKSKLLYWFDSYLRKFEASILRLEVDKKDAYIILDRTIFHPKSGGQPPDRGTVFGEGFRMEVKKAMLMSDVVVHWGKVIECESEVEEVVGEIDWDWRYLLMRRHTAGHLLDHCLTVLTGNCVETTDSWLGDPCYVGYSGNTPSSDLIKGAEELENKLITKGANVKMEFVSFEELCKRAPNAPNIYRLPRLDTFRIVTIEGCKPIPCGGTHLRDIKEIGNIIIKKVEKSKSGYNIYYDVVS